MGWNKAGYFYHSLKHSWIFERKFREIPRNSGDLVSMREWEVERDGLYKSISHNKLPGHKWQRNVLVDKPRLVYLSCLDRMLPFFKVQAALGGRFVESRGAQQIQSHGPGWSVLRVEDFGRGAGDRRWTPQVDAAKPVARHWGFLWWTAGATYSIPGTDVFGPLPFLFCGFSARHGVDQAGLDQGASRDTRFRNPQQSTCFSEHAPRIWRFTRTDDSDHQCCDLYAMRKTRTSFSCILSVGNDLVPQMWIHCLRSMCSQEHSRIFSAEGITNDSFVGAGAWVASSSASRRKTTRRDHLTSCLGTCGQPWGGTIHPMWMLQGPHDQAFGRCLRHTFV